MKNKAQRQAQGRTNRQKGKDGQREFLRLFIPMLTGLPWDHPDQTIRYSSTQHHPDGFLDGSPIDSWHIETKKCNHWKLRAWIREAERDAGPERPWFIAARLSGTLWRKMEEADRWFVILPKAMLISYMVGLPRWYQTTESGKMWHIQPAIQEQDMDVQQCVDVVRSHQDTHWRFWTTDDRPVRLWSVSLERPEPKDGDDRADLLRWNSYSLIPARTWAYLAKRGTHDGRS